MPYLSRCIVLLLLCSMAYGSSHAQQHAVVVLESNMPNALVFADSLLLGVASLQTFVVPQGTATLRLVPDGGESWSISPLTYVLDADGGDTVAVELNFPYHYQIESVPFDAPVYTKGLQGRLLLGNTPFLYTTDEPLDGKLILDKKGYRIEELEPGREMWNRYVVSLTPVQRLDERQTAEIRWEPPVARRRWIDYTAAAVALAAGAFSIQQKFEADRLVDEYEITGDESLRPRFEAYDQRALVGLGVMQAGIGVLAIRFIIR